MKLIIKQGISTIWLALFIISISGCSSLIDKYDKVAYQNATSIKVDSLALVDKAITPYSDNLNTINALKIKIDKAYEYAKGRPKNEIITKQWEIMKSPSRNLFGGFLARWEEKVTLSKDIVAGAKSNISLAFDQIIGLESGKIKPKK